MVKESTLSSKERREHEKLATREMILEAARDMFNEQGVDATTMRAIADRIGYTATAIYYHFKDKDALLLELCHRDFATLGHLIARSGSIKDPIERLRSTGMAYVQFGLDNPSQYRFMFITPSRRVTPEEMPDGLQRHGNPEEDAHAFIRLTVTEAIQKGLVRPEYTDANLLANLLWGALHGIVSLYLVRKHDDWIEFGDPRELARTTIDVVLRGMSRQ